MSFREGVQLDAIGEREPLAGEVDGETVLLFRRGQQVFAIGGTCTHYGGPLAEGIVTGDVVRCPWHHACFDIKTGAASAAPALNPLPRWRTEVRDGRVFVLDKLVREPLDAMQRSAAGPGSVVIVGAGAAGSAAAEMLRREGYQGPISLIDPDADAPYDRPNLSKDYLAGDAPEEWIPLRPPGFYGEHAIEQIQSRVTSIDTANRRVRCLDGRDIEYGALLLATGAAPIRPNLPGATLPNVHVLRSLVDCRALIQAITGTHHVVIAGASFIGMEAAASLRKRGVSVTVVAPESVPFLRVLGPKLGDHLRSRHTANGVAFELGRTIREVFPDRVVLDDGRTIACDVVLLGVGVRPVLDLAAAAGLSVDTGVLVDAFLQTSVPGVFAAGDIAQYPDPRSGERIRIEHWVVAQRQGQTAARNILGRSEPFASAPFFWTHQYDITVNYVGHATAWDSTEATGDLASGDYQISYLKAGRPIAVATIGRDQAALRAEVELEGGFSPTGGK
ncbi:MAG: FAD-dependent oxidoreductase [Gemmatimonadota bacterium]